MLSMHYLVVVSHFAKYGTNRPLIVWEMLTNVKKISYSAMVKKMKKWSGSPVWELPGGWGFNSPRSCACLFVLGVRCNSHRSHLQTLAIFMCHKNVKNTKFSCQHMDFLQLKMHQNPFSANSLGELTSYDAPPDPLVCCGGGHSCQRGSGTPPPHSPSASRSRRLRRLTSEPRVLFS